MSRSAESATVLAMLAGEARRCCFVLVGNIPAKLRSADLRAFFSHLVERRAFVCFHFRHRPEHLATAGAQTALDSVGGERQTLDCSVTAVRASSEGQAVGGNLSVPSESTDGRGASGESSEAARASSSRCCVVAVAREHEPELLRRYGGRHWARSGGTLLGRKVKLSRLRVSFDENEESEESTKG